MATNPARKPYRKVAPTTWAMVRRQYESGYSPSLLCQQYGISPSTFFSRCKREGIARNSAGDAITPSSSTGRAAIRADDCSSTWPPHTDGRSQLALVPLAARTGACPPTNSEFTPSATPGEEITARHLEIASALRYRLDQLMADEQVGAGPQGRKSRSLLDLVTALEKLQRIERQALGMDQTGSAQSNQVVIIVPQKLEENAWAQEAQQLANQIRPASSD